MTRTSATCPAWPTWAEDAAQPEARPGARTPARFAVTVGRSSLAVQ